MRRTGRSFVPFFCAKTRKKIPASASERHPGARGLPRQTAERSEGDPRSGSRTVCALKRWGTNLVSHREAPLGLGRCPNKSVVYIQSPEMGSVYTQQETCCTWELGWHIRCFSSFLARFSVRKARFSGVVASRRDRGTRSGNETRGQAKWRRTTERRSPNSTRKFEARSKNLRAGKLREPTAFRSARCTRLAKRGESMDGRDHRMVECGSTAARAGNRAAPSSDKKAARRYRLRPFLLRASPCALGMRGTTAAARASNAVASFTISIASSMGVTSLQVEGAAWHTGLTPPSRDGFYQTIMLPASSGEIGERLSSEKKKPRVPSKAKRG